jgi:hypothetical protein
VVKRVVNNACERVTKAFLNPAVKLAVIECGIFEVFYELLSYPKLVYLRLYQSSYVFVYADF